MKKVNLEVISNPSPYNQNPQTSDIHFSFLNRTDNGFKELFYRVKCREYLGDAITAAHCNQDSPRIYGFELKGKRASIDEMLLSVSFGEESKSNFLKKIRIIREAEKLVGLPKDKWTEVYSVNAQTPDHINKFVVVGNKFWCSSPLLVSIYTLLLRSLTYSTNRVRLSTHLKAMESLSGVDGGQFRSIKEYGVDWIFLLKNLGNIIKDHPITGIDDSHFFSKISEGYLLNNGIYGMSHPTTGDNKYSWDVDTCHYSHGIVKLSERVKYITGNSQLYSGLGMDWALKYVSILKESKGSNE